MKVAVVGLGKMGLVHTSVLSVVPSVDLQAICEKSDLTRRFFKKIIRHVPILDDVEKLSDFDLDAVYVTTPILSHFQVARAIYANRITKNVFVEKTLAANHAEARELCDLSARSTGVNMVGYLRRFYVTFREAANLLEHGTIGDIHSFHAYAYSSDYAKSSSPNQGSDNRGDLLSDLGCYAMDLALWFFGDLDVKSAETTEVDGQNNKVETVQFVLSQANGLTGVCNVSGCMRDYRMPEVGFHMEGSEGIIEVSDDRVEYRLRSGEGRTWYRHDLNDNSPFWLAMPEYFREDEYFISCVSKGSKAEPCFESASKVDLMIDEVKKNLVMGE